MTWLQRMDALLFLAKQFGWRWLLFRLGYALRMRLGILRWQFPPYEWDERPLTSWLRPDVPAEPQAYAAWRAEHEAAFFFHGPPALPANPPWDPHAAIQQAERILQGELVYFEHTPYQVGFPPDWHRDPHTGLRLDGHQHWSRIPDFGAFDIKFVWEMGRFPQIYALVRAYSQQRDDRYAEAFWKLVEDWARHNPPQRGPHWKCGQETALRLLAWCFGVYAFKASPASTPQRLAHLTQWIAAQAERVERNVAFALSTRGNHAISEAFGLWLVGTLFPELRHAQRYRERGRTLLEQEGRLYFFEDGTYSMYSLNYHRFVLQVYVLALRLGELNGERFSDSLYQAVARSVDFLTHLIEPDNGQVPLYGSNDGARVCPLDGCDFTDYRPILQIGHFLVHRRRLFGPGPWDESLFWLFGAVALRSEQEPPWTPKERGFPHGGVYVLRGRSSKVVLRCTEFRERPSHADQLHLDLWWQGRNLACDAGTYLYHGPPPWQNGLAGTAVHNTVTVDGQDQMVRLSRFTWGRWARGRVIRQDAGLWQGEHDGYARLGVRHVRTVIRLEEDRWLVMDELDSDQPHIYTLHWLLGDAPYVLDAQTGTLCLWPETEGVIVQVGVSGGEAKCSLVRADPTSRRGWRSRYYGHKEPALSFQVETHCAQAIFWTFFGFRGDRANLSGLAMQVQVAGRRMMFPLEAIKETSQVDGAGERPWKK